MNESKQKIAAVVRQCMGLGGSAELGIRRASGGDIHQSFTVEVTGSGQTWFVKLNDANNADVLESEFHSLLDFAKFPQLNYPKPLNFLCDSQCACLVMEYHAIETPDHNSAFELGTLLAAQHQITAARFGWADNNFIGLTPQQNDWNDCWVDFFRSSRLLPQLELAAGRGLDSDLLAATRRVDGQLEDLIGQRDVVPALLHGDLWNGNCGVDIDSQRAILFDPAPYYGDREADLAMTELFGGFAASFYSSYQSHHSTAAEGYPRRKAVYNLYHALNHFNLFGSAYQPMVKNLLLQII